MVNVNNIVGSITKNAEKLGGLTGLLTASPGGFNDIVSSIENLVAGNIHPPNITSTFSALAREGFVTSGIMLWIGGMILEAVPIGGIKKFAKPLQKFGIGYAGGAVASKLLFESTHSDEGSASHIPGFNQRAMFQRNIASANQGYNY